MENEKLNLCSGLAAGEKVDTTLASISEEFAKGIIARVCAGEEISDLERDNFETLVRTGFEAGVIRQRVDIRAYGKRALSKFIAEWLRKNAEHYITSIKNLDDALEYIILELGLDLDEKIAEMFPIVTAK